MRIEVLLFGPYATAVGCDRVEVLIGEDRSARAVLAAVAAQSEDRHPALRPLLPGARLAVNGRFADETDAIQAEDELAIIGLVGGG